jgi:broad specificity phosphatase PhoE
LKRTKDSFALLGIIKTNSLELLNEAELPHGFLKNLKLPLWIWGATIRFLWILGLKKNAESYKEFKKRVENAYFHLSAHSETYNHIAVMGHGFVNRQLKMILQQNGWVHTKRFGGHGYWSFNTFEKKGIRY